MAKNPQLWRRIRQGMELFPAVAFFAGFRFGDLFLATQALIAATIFSLVIVYAVERKIDTSTLVTAAAVFLFGGLTLWLHNDLFIKMKPTIIYAIFAGLLFWGAWRKKGYLKFALSRVFNLSDAAWLTLSLRFAWFFTVLAVLNELVWRNFSVSTWVDFKIFGCITMTVIFFMAQMPFVRKHSLDR